MTDEQTTTPQGPHAHALQLLMDQATFYAERAALYESNAADAEREAARMRRLANDAREGAKACDAAVMALQAAQHVAALQSGEVTA